MVGLMKKLVAVVTVVLALIVAPAASLAGAADAPGPKAPARAWERGHRLARGIAVAAAAIGVEPKELRDALAGGKSVAGVAEAHHVDPQTVIDAVLSAADKKIDEAVANGRIDEARATTIKDRVQDRVAKLLQTKPGPHALDRLRRAKVRGGLRRHVRRAALIGAAKAIGVEPTELGASLRDGKSVADVARANDVEPEVVIDAVVAAGNKKVDEAVANGKLDETRATTIKDRLPDRVTKLVNATRPARTAK
jgi:transposase-like protein